MPAVDDVINKRADARVNFVVTNFLINAKRKEREEYNKVFKEKRMYNKLVPILEEMLKDKSFSALDVNQPMLDDDSASSSRKRTASSNMIEIKPLNGFTEEALEGVENEDEEEDSEMWVLKR